MADSKENDKFDLVVRVKRRRSKSAKLETIISFCHQKKNKTKQKIADVFFIVHMVKVRTS